MDEFAQSRFRISRALPACASGRISGHERRRAVGAGLGARARLGRRCRRRRRFDRAVDLHRRRPKASRSMASGMPTSASSTRRRPLSRVCEPRRSAAGDHRQLSRRALVLAFVNDLFDSIEKAETRQDSFRYDERDRFPIDDAASPSQNREPERNLEEPRTSRTPGEPRNLDRGLCIVAASRSLPPRRWSPRKSSASSRRRPSAIERPGFDARPAGGHRRAFPIPRQPSRGLKRRSRAPWYFDLRATRVWGFRRR